MKAFVLLSTMFLFISSASAQTYRYFDNRGNNYGIYSTPYGTAVFDVYGYRGYAVPFYRPVYPTYTGPMGWYGGWGQSGYYVPGGFIPMGYGW
jgi:hypothetical protein